MDFLLIIVHAIYEMIYSTATDPLDYAVRTIFVAFITMGSLVMATDKIISIIKTYKKAASAYDANDLHR